jgi:hypothetical protein
LSPTLINIDGIRICVYSREHRPAHFHVLYAEYEMTIDLTTLEKISGTIPLSKERAIRKWIEQNKELILKNFNRLNPDL